MPNEKIDIVGNNSILHELSGPKCLLNSVLMELIFIISRLSKEGFYQLSRNSFLIVFKLVVNIENNLAYMSLKLANFRQNGQLRLMSSSNPRVK